MKTNVAALAALMLALLAAEPTTARPGDVVYSPADTNQDCIIQFSEYQMAPHILLSGGMTFRDYQLTKRALLRQNPYYDALAPEDYQCRPT
jgi:hypothetical protein